MTDPLWPRMNAALNRLELRSETPAANLAPSGGGGKPGSKMLRMDGLSERDYWLGQWYRPHGPYRTREEVVQAAEEALKPFESGNVKIKEETPQERDRRILQTKYEGETPERVSQDMWGDVTAKMVRDCRERHDLQTHDGRPWPVDEAVETRVARLASMRLSERDIARQVGSTKSTVRRILGRAA